MTQMLHTFQGEVLENGFHVIKDHNEDDLLGNPEEFAHEPDSSPDLEKKLQQVVEIQDRLQKGLKVIQERQGRGEDVSHLWDFWRKLQQECKDLVGQDTVVWAMYFQLVNSGINRYDVSEYDARNIDDQYVDDAFQLGRTWDILGLEHIREEMRARNFIDRPLEDWETGIPTGGFVPRCKSGSWMVYRHKKEMWATRCPKLRKLVGIYQKHLAMVHSAQLELVQQGKSLQAKSKLTPSRKAAMRSKFDRLVGIRAKAEAALKATKAELRAYDLTDAEKQMLRDYKASKATK